MSQAPGMTSWMLKALSTRTATNPHLPPSPAWPAAAPDLDHALDVAARDACRAVACETTERPTTRGSGPSCSPIGGPWEVLKRVGRHAGEMPRTDRRLRERSSLMSAAAQLNS